MPNTEPDQSNQTLAVNPAPPLHVAVGVIKNQEGEVLISRRHRDTHQGGLWEFPGGKVEPGETVLQALSRELKEELNLTVRAAAPLIKITHQYADIAVLLDVWMIDKFSGAIEACEGQPIQWTEADQLSAYAFPAANLPIINASRLPRSYAILAGNHVAELQQNLQMILARQVKLIQLRAKSLGLSEVQEFLAFATPLCKNNGARLLLNSAVKQALQLAVDGIHFTSRHLLSLERKPSGLQWVSGSCHSVSELLHAEKIGLDFAVLAPVSATPTHPEAVPLGWAGFANMLAKVNLPVYALGGVNQDDMGSAIQAGAQGIAGIRAFID